MKLPIIDVSAFANNSDLTTNDQKQVTAKEIHSACIDTGFFLIKVFLYSCA